MKKASSYQFSLAALFISIALFAGAAAILRTATPNGPTLAIVLIASSTLAGGGIGVVFRRPVVTSVFTGAVAIAVIIWHFLGFQR